MGLYNHGPIYATNADVLAWVTMSHHYDRGISPVIQIGDSSPFELDMNGAPVGLVKTKSGYDLYLNRRPTGKWMQVYLVKLGHDLSFISEDTVDPTPNSEMGYGDPIEFNGKRLIPYYMPSKNSCAVMSHDIDNPDIVQHAYIRDNYRYTVNETSLAVNDSNIIVGASRTDGRDLLIWRSYDAQIWTLMYHYKHSARRQTLVSPIVHNINGIIHLIYTDRVTDKMYMSQMKTFSSWTKPVVLKSGLKGLSGYPAYRDNKLSYADEVSSTECNIETIPVLLDTSIEGEVDSPVDAIAGSVITFHHDLGSVPRFVQLFFKAEAHHENEIPVPLNTEGVFCRATDNTVEITPTKYLTTYKNMNATSGVYILRVSV